MNTVQGFCDFNISSKCNPTTTLKDVLRRAVELGYSSIAVNTTLDEEYLIPTKKKGKKKEDVVEQKEIPPPPNISISEADLSSIKSHGKSIKILQRLTVKLSDPSNTQKLVQSVNAKKYDILAVLPINFASFQHAVANMDVDIITFEPETVTDFRFNRRHYRQATDRGLFFEIPYSLLLRDSTSRKKTIQTAHLYHAIGKSRNIIVSSGATLPLELRGPYDVANFSLLLGLTEGEARAALTLSCRSVALHAAARKTGKCVSSVTATNQLKDEEKWKAREIQKAEDDILKEPNSKKIKLETS